MLAALKNIMKVLDRGVPTLLLTISLMGGELGREGRAPTLLLTISLMGSELGREGRFFALFNSGEQTEAFIDRTSPIEL